MIRIIIILFLFCTSSTIAQLTTVNQSATNLVQNTLTGPGVTVSGVTFTGSANTAIGKFTATGVPGFNFGSGVVITTGTIFGVEGPIGPNTQLNAGVANGLPGNAQLNALIGGTTYDASVLEFDFIPLSDTVRFRYVFGSEEYPEYVGSVFNDVFAFFISGPGIPGGVQNMAQLPNGNGIVTINNVNNGNGTANPPSNPAYFFDNTAGGANSLEYDGFTVALTAMSPVICGATYHLRIAIADVGDGIFDSGIFLEANSLTANVSVNIATAISNNAYNDPNIMAEGCTNGTVTITRVGVQTPNTPALTIPITMLGTATELVDYSDIPASVTFLPGETVKIINFTTIGDALAEGQESIIFQFGIDDPCGNENNQTKTLYIRDILPLTVTLGDTSILCPGDNVTLVPLIIGGGGTYVYSWAPIPSATESITVAPNGTTSYTITVTESCLNQTVSATSVVSVPIAVPISLVTTANFTQDCPFIPAALTVEATGGNGVYTYVWSTNAPTNYPEIPNVDPNNYLMGTGVIQNILPPATSTYTVTVSDQCGLVSSKEIVVTILTPPIAAIATPKQIICPGDSAFIGVNVSGGKPYYEYDWLHSADTLPVVWVKPQSTTVYTVNISDQCATYKLPKTIEVEIIRPSADFSFADNFFFEGVPITFSNQSQGALTYYWDFGNGGNSTVVNPNEIYRPPGNYLVTLIAIDALGCKDTISKVITITPEWYIYVPNAFTPDDDGRINRTFKVSTVNILELEILIFNRWGEVVFSSDDKRFQWDGSYKGNNAQDGVYNYAIKYKNILGEELEILGHVVLLK
jgi:gliding motility-associated-like protein